MHDKSLDQEALVGGKTARKRLNDLPPDEAKEEIRLILMLVYCTGFYADG